MKNQGLGNFFAVKYKKVRKKWELLVNSHKKFREVFGKMHKAKNVFENFAGIFPEFY